MSDMLPCPFCGGEAEIIKDYETNCFGEKTVSIKVSCTVCKARPYEETVYGTTEDPQQLKDKIEDTEFALKEKWNKREETK